MARRAAAKKNNIIRVDLSDVDVQGRFREDGEFLLEVVVAEKRKGDKDDYISWELVSVDEPVGAKVWNNTSLSPQSLWNLRAMLEAMGVEIPDDEFDLDLDEMVGNQLMGVVEIEESGEYKGKPRLVDFFAPEEKPAPKGKASAKKKAKVEDEDEDEDGKPARRGAKKKPAKAPAITEDDLGDMSQDELQDVIDTHGLDVDLEDFKTLRKMQAAVIDAAQEADILGEAAEEPEEEEEKPARRRRAAKEEPEEDEEDERPTRRARRSRR